MRLLINGVQGRIYHAEAHPALRAVRPLYCFVPDFFATSGDFHRVAYIHSRFPSVNCGCNPHGIGSHVFPDMGSPLEQDFDEPVLHEFIRNLAAYVHPGLLQGQ